MTAMMTVTGQITLMKLRSSLDAGVKMHFRLKVPLSLKRYEIGTDPVNIKHPVMWVSQHQLSFLFYPRNEVSGIFATATCLSVHLSQPVLCIND